MQAVTAFLERLTEVKGVLEDLDGWIGRKLRVLLWRRSVVGQFEGYGLQPVR